MAAQQEQTQQATSSSSSSSSSATTKSVTFAGTAKMRLSKHINNYTPEEIAATYYNSEDFRSFKTEVKRTLRMMEMKLKIDETILCTRGVESRTKEAVKIRSRVRAKAMSAVFKGQMQQFILQQEGQPDPASDVPCHDDEKIASAYSYEVRPSIVAAYMTGLSDELIARELMEHEEKYLDKETGSNVASMLMGLRKSNKSTRTTRKEIYNSAA